MAMATASVMESQLNKVLVAGTSGKRILVTRVMYSSTSPGQLTLKSRLGSGTATTIFGWVRLDFYATHDAQLGREYAVATLPGEDLVFTNSMEQVGHQFQLTVWYELVP